MEWREIKRDRFGFAEDDCLDLIYHQLPVVLKHKGWLITDLVCKDNWEEMRGDIERYPYCTHYYPVPELPKEEDEE